MKIEKFSLPFLAFLQATGLTIYIGLVALFMFNAERLFGSKIGVLGPILFLLLFIISATISGLIVLARPGFLFWEKRYKESFTLLGWTVGWLLLYFIIILLILLAGKNLILK
ncbi:MAG: hypothetical protein M1450_04390 [Patescibacteria group bacterium]|nr:hypothetical protein [Patescibacteria group bacterium]